MTADHPTPAEPHVHPIRETLAEALENDRCGICLSVDHFREDCPMRAELARRDAALADLTRQRDEARELLSQVDYALRNLVSLKDGPRNLAYEHDKPHAWQLAREAVTAVDLYRSAALGPVDPEATDA